MTKQVILLNGPSSSGKSTLAKGLQAFVLDRTGERCEIVSIDDFMCKILSEDETIYEDDVYEISGDMCAEVLRLLESAPCVIVDHVITSERIFRQFTDAMCEKSLLTVRIDCPLEILLQREQARKNRCLGSAQASYTYLYPKDSYDVCVDTHSATTEQCCKVIFETLEAKERPQ